MAAVLALLLLVIAWHRIDAVEGIFPYSIHVDETFFTRPVVRMIHDRDPNPQFFRYPSLPLYLSVATILSRAAIAPDGSERLEALQPTSHYYPYTQPELYWPVRVLFALMSVAALGCVAGIAWTAFGRAEALLAPLLLSGSGVFQLSALEYLNVDVAAALFVAATLAAVFHGWERDDFYAKAVLPGVLAGLAVASKYNSGLVLVPCALAIAFQAREGRLAKLAALGGVSAVSFFVCVPYSLIESQGFIHQVLWEVDHYRTSPGFPNVGPGWAQFRFYMTALWADFGSVAVVSAAFGIVYGFARDWRRTLTLLSLPVLMIAHMSTNRVNFLRTVMAVFIVCSIFQAIGFVGAARLIEAKWAELRPVQSVSPRWRVGVYVACGVAGLVFVTPHLHTERWLDRNIKTDSRNLATHWMLEHCEQERILIARDVLISGRDMKVLSAEAIGPELAGLARLLRDRPDERACLLLPDYAEVAAPGGRGLGSRVSVPSRRREISRRLTELETEFAAEERIRFEGLPATLRSTRQRGTVPGGSPALRILEVPPRNANPAAAF
jgi:hypothetical protein